jgi:UDP-xylose/UDP-N-acetylglucosamine transporter B4
MNLKVTNDKRGALEDDHGFGMLFWWSIGILLMTISLFVSARMGLFQETMYKKHGKHPDEALFYTHFLPLPAFIPLIRNIIFHSVVALRSAPISFQFLEIHIPSQVLYLIGNMITQYVCIKSVYVLTTECSSLTVTLVVTLRKFASLLFSIFYFQNPFTSAHWLGTLFVFVGTVIFVEIVPKIMEMFENNKCSINGGNENEDRFKLESKRKTDPHVNVHYQPLVTNEDDENED